MPNLQAAATKVGLFLRLLDKDKRLSLTNIAVMIALYKFLTAADAVQPLDFGALISTLLTYTAKKVIQKNDPPAA